MIKEVKINRPARLNGVFEPTKFIPPNSKDQLIEIDLGFTINPVYRQEKLCYFVDEQVYYQKLTLVDGKKNAIKDDERSIIITGVLEQAEMITFEPDIHPSVPASAIGTGIISLPFFPEVNTEFFIRGKEKKNAFYHFSCTKIMHRPGGISYLQLRYLGNHYYQGMVAILRKWHTDPLSALENIAEVQ